MSLKRFSYDLLIDLIIVAEVTSTCIEICVYLYLYWRLCTSYSSTALALPTVDTKFSGGDPGTNGPDDQRFLYVVSYGI